VKVQFPKGNPMCHGSGLSPDFQMQPVSHCEVFCQPGGGRPLDTRKLPEASQEGVLPVLFQQILFTFRNQSNRIVKLLDNAPGAWSGESLFQPFLVGDTTGGQWAGDALRIAGGYTPGPPFPSKPG